MSTLGRDLDVALTPARRLALWELPLRLLGYLLLALAAVLAVQAGHDALTAALPFVAVGAGAVSLLGAGVLFALAARRAERAIDAVGRRDGR